MASTTDDTDVKCDIKLSWAIYGGHISGRRSRGVKTNPLYQESDSGVNREDGQSGASSSTSEIEIETYESLPRQSFVRSSVSVPNIFQTHTAGLSRFPYVYNGHVAYLGDVEIQDEPRNFSEFSLPRPRDNVKFQTDLQELTDINESVESDKNKDQTRPYSWPQMDRGYRKQLAPQSGIEATADEPDVVELTEILPSTSSGISVSSFSLENPRIPEMKRRDTPRVLTPKSFQRKMELSVLQEQSGVFENEQSQEVDFTASVTTVADVYYDSSDSSSTSTECPPNHASTNRVSCDMETTTLQISQEISHTLSFTDGSLQAENNLFSTNNSDSSFISKTVINISYPLFDGSDTIKGTAT